MILMMRRDYADYTLATQICLFYILNIQGVVIRLRAMLHAEPTRISE